MQLTMDKPKKKRNRTPRVADCHPDRPHYAKGKCRQCYRAEFREDRSGSDAAYEASDAGRARREKYDKSEAGRARKRRWKAAQKAKGSTQE